MLRTPQVPTQLEWVVMSEISGSSRRIVPPGVLSHRTAAPGRSIAGLAADVVLVMLFAVLGNRSHASGLTVPDVWSTAWPFLLGLGLSWLLAFSWGNPHRIWPTGVFVVLGTVGLGMVFREVFTDGGVQVSFVAVALGAITLLLLTRRALFGLLARRRVG